MAPAPQICTTQGYIFLHAVRVGESLSRIVQHYYGGRDPHARAFAIAQVLADNPAIRHPDRIFPHQLLVLRMPLRSPPPNAYVRESLRSAEPVWHALAPDERVATTEVAPLLHHLDTALEAGGAGLAAFELLVRSNTPTLHAIAQGYEAYRAGELTKGQYDYQRRRLIQHFERRIGPLRRLTFGHSLPRELLRIKPGGGPGATRALLGQISRFTTLGRYAAKGGVILSVVGLGLSCRQIALAGTSQEKNEIAVEAVMATAVGALGGLVIGAFLLSNPVGWVVALAIGVGAALFGVVAGHQARRLYQEFGQSYPIVETLWIDQVCR
jgi:hypothetical protein